MMRLANTMSCLAAFAAASALQVSNSQNGREEGGGNGAALIDLLHFLCGENRMDMMKQHVTLSPKRVSTGERMTICEGQ